ncbi:hypothetical protein [Streptomyces fractus]|uniref:hypothetical protein n=1 Tax=Streptomyces fractus TaxID=641806 RepID=UPI003CF02DC8
MQPRPGLDTLTRQGVLLTAQALDAGWPMRALHRALARDGWSRVRAGARVAPGREIDLRTQLLVEQLLNPRLVVSHLAAAWLWRIETLGPTPPSPEFTDPTLRTNNKGGLRRRAHRSRLDPTEVREVRGLRVTSPVRTVTDLLLAGPRDAALVAVESAVTRRTVHGVRRARLTGLTAVADALNLPHPPRRSQAWLRLADPASGSPAETVARLAMLDAGLRPESQAELITHEGRQVFVDFLFRAEGLAVEIEGYAYHGTREHHRRDIDRFNRIQSCPQVRALLRFTAVDVFRGRSRFSAEVHRALAALRKHG